MSWLDLIWAAAVAVLTLGVIGGSLAWAVGLRGFWAVAAAPAFGLTLIGGTAIVAPWLGLSWSLVPVLIEQLAVGGQLVAPVGGSGSQSLVRLVKREDGSIEETTLAPVVFVPLLSGTLD